MGILTWQTNFVTYIQKEQDWVALLITEPPLINFTTMYTYISLECCIVLLNHDGVCKTLFFHIVLCAVFSVHYCVRGKYSPNQIKFVSYFRTSETFSPKTSLEIP